MLELITLANNFFVDDIAQWWLEGIKEGKTLRTSITFLICVARHAVPLVWKTVREIECRFCSFLDIFGLNVGQINNIDQSRYYLILI